ncbi:Uclacyanin-3 [Camellia lanceoleosa]|uniref:Uclacyanin-3 n=1 Tax=Camellia lanceoleosa TaxID=1840588 RepID=A0ACC0IUC9_9ERIC|nr:Uclacyanin-3 [Camellia lanceoleosa]
MAMVAALMMILVIAAPAAYATQYTVGDTAGWAQQVDYTTWVSGKTFRVNDTLLFTYGTTHSVDVVTQSNYNSCNSANALASYNGGNTVVNLNTTGAMYFICPTAGHCQSGMKLAVTVAAASTSPPGSPSPPGTPPSTTSPPPPPPPPSSGAVGNFGHKSFVVLGLSLLVGALSALMS